MIPVPILLPGEKTSTRIEPEKSLYEQIPLVTQNEGIVDAAILVGYPWADEFRNHGVVMVTGDNKKAVTSGAEKLANQFWESRNDFKFVAPTTTLDESLKLALKSKLNPFIISDMGDNPTAGGAGDVTHTLNQLLLRSEFKNSNGPSLIYASIPGPDLIKKAYRFRSWFFLLKVMLELLLMTDIALQFFCQEKLHRLKKEILMLKLKL